MPARYTFVALIICLDDLRRRVLMVQESRVDCRGKFYVPGGRAYAGEDPVHASIRITAEKTGLTVELVGILGVEHNPPIGQFPGQLRVVVVARPMDGTLKRVDDEHSMAASWVPLEEVGKLKLRSDDFLPWLDDAVLGEPRVLPPTSWRSSR